MVLFLLAALLLLGRRWWFAAGVCTALATLTWQPSLAVVAAAAVVSLACAPSGRVRGALSYVAGGAVPTALTALYYLLHDNLRLAVDGFLLVNAEYTRQPSLLGAPHRTWQVLWDGIPLVPRGARGRAGRPGGDGRGHPAAAGPPAGRRRRGGRRHRLDGRGRQRRPRPLRAAAVRRARRRRRGRPDRRPPAARPLGTRRGGRGARRGRRGHRGRGQPRPRPPAGARQRRRGPRRGAGRDAALDRRPRGDGARPAREPDPLPGLQRGHRRLPAARASARPDRIRALGRAAPADPDRPLRRRHPDLAGPDARPPLPVRRPRPELVLVRLALGRPRGAVRGPAREPVATGAAVLVGWGL